MLLIKFLTPSCLPDIYLLFYFFGSLEGMALGEGMRGNEREIFPLFERLFS